MRAYKKNAFVFFISLALILITTVYFVRLNDTTHSPRIEKPAGVQETTNHYAGSNACMGCHPKEDESWRESDHFHAMELATTTSVLGDFHDQTFNYFGRQSKFTQRDDLFLVETENQQGIQEVFKVAYTLGHWPLQQYLVAFDDGRIQTLPFSWDARPKENGGQRWFHIYPEENITPDNPLFWMGSLQNWNHMCGDCHTTGFKKNFSDVKNTFTSHWEELADGCESCHGAGSAHIDLMKKNPGQKNNLLIKTLRGQTDQIDQCGACHARRNRLEESPVQEKMMQSWQPELLRDGLYFHDGQIRDEVFVTGSFLQSKMYAAGVSCIDCHDPHSNKVKIDGNGLCTQCHASTYDSMEHHQHPVGSEGAQCVNCHMPQRVYMVVDPRRDHSFTIPRVGLSHETGVPNACSNCHEKKTFEKNNDQVGKLTHYGEAFWQARNEQLAAKESLLNLITRSSYNPIVKATALMELGPFLDESALDVLRTQLNNADALIRYGAVQALASLSPEQRMALLISHLEDDALSIRLAMAPLLVDADTHQLTSSQQQAIKNIFSEYKNWLLQNADRANALVSLAGLSLFQGDVLAAQKYFDKALERDPTSLAAYLNYADYYRSLENDGESEKLLRKALAIYPDSADVHFSLGLLLVRQQQKSMALAELKLATQLAPANSHYLYVYGVGLYSEGQREDALAVLKSAQERFPANQAIRSALQAYGQP